MYLSLLSVKLTGEDSVPIDVLKDELRRTLYTLLTCPEVFTKQMNSLIMTSVSCQYMDKANIFILLRYAVNYIKGVTLQM